MDILLLTNELSRDNGWATVSYYLKRELDNRHRVFVITEEELKTNNYCNLLTLITTFKRVAKTAKPFDVIICNVEPYLPLAALLKRKYRAKLIFVGHGTYTYFPFIKGWKGKYNRFFSRFIDRLIVPSQYTKNRVSSWWPYEIDLVKWGVDIEMYHPVDVRKQKAFVFVGEQKARKGVKHLIQAFEKLIQADSDVKLYFLGKANHDIRRIVIERNMQDHVFFKGHVTHDELLKYLSLSMCHVLPSVNAESSFEGFGLVHLEANACGIPSIGSKNSANESVIEPGINGFLVEQGSSNDLYLTMKEIIDDPGNTLKLYESSLKHARQNTWGMNLAGFVDIVDRMNPTNSPRATYCKT